MRRKQWEERDFADSLMCASVDNHYDSGALDSLCADMQSKNRYLKMIEVQS
jgi:hypothetical protein